MTNDEQQHKRCPYCGEEILKEARKCRFCGEWLEEEDAGGQPEASGTEVTETVPLEEEDEEKPSVLRHWWKALLALLAVLLFFGVKTGLKEWGSSAGKSAAKDAFLGQSDDGGGETAEEEQSYAFKVTDFFWPTELLLTNERLESYAYDDETSYEDFVIPAIAAEEVVSELMYKLNDKYPAENVSYSDKCKAATAKTFETYSKYLMSLPIEGTLEAEGVDLTATANRAYYDFRPYRAELIETGYGYQTYHIKRPARHLGDQGERYVKFLRGESGEVVIQISWSR